MGAIQRWCADAVAALGKWQDLDYPRRDLAPVPTLPFVTTWHEDEPYALVAVVSPWNLPLLLAFIDAIPALLAGCAVAIKPSEVAPRFAAVARQTLETVPRLHKVRQATRPSEL